MSRQSLRTQIWRGFSVFFSLLFSWLYTLPLSLSLSFILTVFFSILESWLFFFLHLLLHSSHNSSSYLSWAYAVLLPFCNRQGIVCVSHTHTPLQRQNYISLLPWIHRKLQVPECKEEIWNIFSLHLAGFALIICQKKTLYGIHYQEDNLKSSYGVTQVWKNEARQKLDLYF